MRPTKTHSGVSADTGRPYISCSCAFSSAFFSSTSFTLKVDGISAFFVKVAFIGDTVSFTPFTIPVTPFAMKMSSSSQPISGRLMISHAYVGDTVRMRSTYFAAQPIQLMQRFTFASVRPTLIGMLKVKVLMIASGRPYTSVFGSSGSSRSKRPWKTALWISSALFVFAQSLGQDFFIIDRKTGTMPQCQSFTTTMLSPP
mmetsp:Transcript_50081/g.68365  ORF Transcript_50081/g.68365 Transcript_50081/m.68365 type:complete len:200 (-) Transcript_50081:507-1106(-)